MSKIFGGSKSKSQQSSQNTSVNESGNLNNQAITSAYSPTAASAYNTGVGALQAGLAGGYDAYKANTGFDFWSKLGLNKVAGGQAGRGLFNSGATMKALSNYQNQIGTASYNDYLQQQSGLAGLGLQGGNLIAGVGQYSKGESQGTSQGTASSKTNKGIGETLAAAASIAAAGSDVRLKKNIEKVGEHAGLGVYKYDYINDYGPYIGVMAQEVREKYPEALGPEVGGYLTVNYGKLQEMTGEITYG